MENKFGVVFGDLSGEVSQWADEYASSIGRNSNTIKGWLADNQNMFVGMGMTREQGAGLSENLVKLALDLASFNNLQEPDAVDRLSAALMGESEAAKSLGAVLNENTLAMAMETMGIKEKFDALSEAEKMEVRYQAILMQSTDAIGDCERSMGSYKSTTIELNSAKEKLQETIGGYLLPAMTKLVAVVTEVVRGLTDMVNWAAQNRDILLALATVIGVVVSGIGLYNTVAAVKAAMDAAQVTTLGALITAQLSAAASTIAMVAPYIAIAAAIAGVVAIGVALYKNWDTVKAKALEVFGVVKDFVGKKITELNTAFDRFKTKVSEVFETIKNYIRDKIEVVKTTFDSFKAKVSETFGAVQDFIHEKIEAVKTTFDKLKTKASEVWDTICRVVQTGAMLIGSVVDGMKQLILLPFNMIWQNCGDFITQTWNNIVSFLTNTVNKIVNNVKQFWTDIKVSFWEGGGGITGIVEVIFDQIVNFIRNLFKTIGNIFNVDLSAISDTVVTRIQTIRNNIIDGMVAIQEKIKAVWNAVKSATVALFDALKNTVNTAMNAIKGIIDKLKTAVNNEFKAMSDAVSKVMNTVKNTVTSVWNAVYSTVAGIVTKLFNVVKNAVDKVKTAVSNGFNAVKKSVSSIMNSVKSAVSTAWNAVYNAVTNVVKKLQNSVKSGFNAIKTTAGNVFNGVKNAILKPLNSVKDTVTKLVTTIKNYFKNMKISLPKIKLPHFKVTGKLSISPPSVPKLSIDWYAKAMGNPVMFTKPTLFNVNPITGTALGAGEAGDEMMYGHSNLMRDIRNAVAEASNADMRELLAECIYTMQEMRNSMQNMRVVLDSGSLIVGTVEAYNRQLGKIVNRRG